MNPSWKRGAAAWTAVGAVLLLGCGTSPQSAPRAAAESYFPMVDGTRWRYAISSAAGSLELEVTAEGPRTLPGESLAVYLMDERSFGASFGFDALAPVGYLVEDGYVTRLEGIGYDGEGRLRRLGQQQATRLLPLEPKVGDSWTQSNRLFATPEGGGARMGWRGRVGERTRVRVPAGTFDDVVEIITTYSDESSDETAPKIVYHDYYARGIGLVKSVTQDPSGDPAHRIEQVLLAYHPPGS